MWKRLKALFLPTPPDWLCRSVDFTRPTKEHWAKFQGGENYDARFLVRGQVAVGDEIRIKMRSGRIGCFRIRSRRLDFMGSGDYIVQAIALGYASDSPPQLELKGLPVKGPRWVRSDSGELAHLPSGFTKPASEFWKILARDASSGTGTDSVCAKRDL